MLIRIRSRSRLLVRQTVTTFRPKQFQSSVAATSSIAAVIRIAFVAALLRRKSAASFSIRTPRFLGLLNVATLAPCSQRSMASSANDAADSCLAAVPSRRVGVVQMTSTNNADANFEICARLARRAKSEGCVMVFFPECFAFIGAFPGEAQRIAEKIDGPWMQRYRELAKRECLWLSLGGFHEYGDGEKIFNAHVILDDHGETQAHYRKIHLFDVPMVGLVESKQTMPGADLVAVDSPIGRLGVTICYDVRFPEVYQKLRFRHGADILLVPSAFAVKTGRAHWELLLRTRAVETQCYVIAAAQVGQHNADGNKRCSYGHTMVVDPWGDIIQDLGGEAVEGGGDLFVFDVDPDVVQRTRANMPIHEHRRYDIYGGPPHAVGALKRAEPEQDTSGSFFG